MKLSRVVCVFLSVVVLFACSSTSNQGKVLINGIQMPPVMYRSVISGSHGSIEIFWYIVRGYYKEISAHGVRETVFEKEPLDSISSTAFPEGTASVEIFLVINNPENLEYRLWKEETSDDLSRKSMIYCGIKGINNIILPGPIARDRQNGVKARIELVGEESSSSDRPIEFEYSIKSSGG